MTLDTQFAAFQRDYPYRETVRAGRTWHYRVGGTPDGPPVLVLAGATTVPDPLFVIIADLGRRYRVIAPAYPPLARMDDLVDGVAAGAAAPELRCHATRATKGVPP